MNDRELLIAAAKAAGMNVLPANQRWPEGAEGWFHTSREDDVTLYSTSAPRFWNPLTDDGDALRLAVKLRIHIQFTKPAHSKDADRVQASPMGHGHLADVVMFENDDAAATRRAIVRAAAAIGAKQ